MPIVVNNDYQVTLDSNTKNIIEIQRSLLSHLKQWLPIKLCGGI